MTKLKHCLLIILALSVATENWAQPFTFKHLSVEDGLPNNYVSDIVQDKQGFIWIATESGLSRFDGNFFTVFEENTSDLLCNALNALLYDKDSNKLWIGTKEGISVLDCSSYCFENYTTTNDVVIDNVVHLCHAKDSGIWITNHHGGITYYDKKTGQFSTFGETIKETKFSHWYSFDDGKGNLYIGHALSGLSIVNLKTQVVRHYKNNPGDPKTLPGNSIYSICVDHLQNIWVGTNQGLALYFPQTEDFMTFRHIPSEPSSLVADHIYSIQEMSDGQLWIASDLGGISTLDLQTLAFRGSDKMKFHNTLAGNGRNSLSSGNIRTLLQDSFGNIWIGNYSSGVDFISHTPYVFNTLRYVEEGIISKNRPVWGICSDIKQERVWIGGQNEIALFQNNQLVKTIPLTGHINRPYGQAFSIKCDSKGLLWLGIFDDGLLTYDERQNRFERIQLGIDNMDIFSLFEDSDGRMWIGAEYGIYSFFDGKVTREENLISQVKDWSIYGILRDRQGKLWIGTSGGGVSVFDESEKEITHLSTKNGFCSNSISQLFLDSKGGIWVATRKGLAYIPDSNHPEQFEIYGYTQGLADTHVRAVYEDQAENIWLSTNAGISLWNKETQEFHNYDFRDGILTGNFVEGSVCSIADGTVYFGSLSGCCYFKPAELIYKQAVAPVQIIECKGFDRQMGNRNEEFIIPITDGKIELPYNRNTFKISFAVPDFSQNQQVEYAYRMKGLDDSWYDIKRENQTTFRNLAPGKYQFSVKVKLKNQDWDETQIATLAVRIHPPLWLTWYAKLIYLIIAGLAAYLMLRSYKNKLNLQTSLELERKDSLNKQELNNERLRFYTNITHELRTPLTLILGPLEDLIHDPELQASYKKRINIIHGSAIRLLNLINQILEFRKTETQNRHLTVSKEDLGNLVKEIGLRYKELNQNKKTDIHIGIETEETILYFDTDMITTILNNLLSNAMKYTPEGEINLIMRSVSDEKNNRYTEIEVSDTGYGIDTKALPRIFDRYYQTKGKHQASGTGIGLSLVKSLVELHEGLIFVESKTGEGSSFFFRLLTENTYPTALHTEKKPVSSSPGTDLIIQQQEEANDMLPIVLVIEDNPDICDYIASSITSNYTVYTASNGKGGLELARKYIPNIIVSDIIMPEMDGIELCRILKADINTSHIPVVLLTAKDTIQDKEEGYESGADSYLTKPFSAKLLLSRIHNLLESRKRLANQVAVHTRKIEKNGETSPPKFPQMSKLDDEFLSKIVALIEENLNMENLDITFLRNKVNMSYSTFYRKMKALTGVSANEFIRKIRLKNSAQLLISGSYNVSESAYMSGFNDISYFRQCFKDEFGMTPTEYLSKLLKSEEQ